MRFGEAFVGAARGVKIRPQAGVVEYPVEAAAAFAGGDGEQKSLFVQLAYRLVGAREQRNLGVLGHEMDAVALGQPGVIRLHHVGKQGGNRLVQPQADDVARRVIARFVHADVAAGGLDRGDDGGRRIHQRAIPVEYQQFKSLRHVQVCPVIAGSVPVLAAAARPGSAFRPSAGVG